MSVRETVIENLNCFYERQGIVHSNFDCKYSTICNEIVSKRGRKIRGTGSQAHVGHNYGEEYRVLVLSLDTGGGGSDTIEQRTENVESGKYARGNRHMPGTIEILRLIYPNKLDSERLKYFAMTNSAKCSGDSQEKLPRKVYKKCAEFQIEEIKIINPELLISQGNDAFPDYLNPESYTNDDLSLFWKYIDQRIDKEDIISTINKYVKKIKLTDNKIIPLIYGPHPSARQGLWQSFRDNSLPKLNHFIQYLKQNN
jgi:uracil-DNA glycosylase